MCVCVCVCVCVCTFVNDVRVFTLIGSSNETAFSSGCLIGGVAPGLNAKGLMFRPTYTRIAEKMIYGRHDKSTITKVFPFVIDRGAIG